ncbi:hypothetical protein [Gordonia soli]|uniref:Diacylglycerol O-acyltransferase n=1 Tax=Gordonia soli NBRC 108243 TaxID=1223545 RepID=M0QMH0_9ACTN|nr:hypothetical protein [Gordonia soli]GAC69768.1 hypothetical protein GS4_28_00160 [Gordonia soli NBRC 108243]
MRSGDTMVRRVSGADESYLLAEQFFGLRAPIQFIWSFADDPGFDAVVDLRDRLAEGALNRAVVGARVPGARHRWVRAHSIPSLDKADQAISDEEIGAWADERLRQSRLAPADGHGWRLDTVSVIGGGRVVSLLVSHMIADGEGVYRALAAARSADPSSAALPERHDDAESAMRGDARDALRQVGAAGRALRQLVRAATAARRRPDGTDPTPAPTGVGEPTAQQVSPQPAPVVRVGAGLVDPEPTLAILDLDRDELHKRAAEHGGTANSLFTAVLAGVMRRSSYPVDGPLRVCMAVNTRAGDADDRANASGGVWIRLPDPVEPADGLSMIRALSKRAFADYAATGADQVADNLQPVVRLLPRPVVRRLMQSVPGPDTTVSNLGVAPADVLIIGDSRPSSFAIRAIMQGRPAANRREQGPALAAWAVEYGDRVTLTFFGIHPDHFGDVDHVREIVGAELAEWGLGHRWW